MYLPAVFAATSAASTPGANSTRRNGSLRSARQADAPRSSPRPLRLSAERWGAIPNTCIVCSQDRALPVSAQHWFCERAPEVDKRVMHADHSPFFSDPDGLAAIITDEL